jgi:hypothetical protein
MSFASAFWNPNFQVRLSGALINAMQTLQDSIKEVKKVRAG